MNRFLIFFISLLFSQILLAKEYSPEDIVNPNKADRRVYVADPADLVSPSAQAQANKILWNLRQQTGAEAVVVVVPNTGDYTREEFAVKLFDNWGVGKSDNDNGVIILIVPDQREAWIATGYGVEGVIPDIAATKIVNRSVVPYMKQNNLDGAVVAVAQDVATVLSQPEAAEELKSKNKEAWDQMHESDVTSEDFAAFILMVVISLFIISWVKFIVDSRSLKNKERYLQARGWNDSQTTYLLLGIFSLGLGIIPYFLAKRRYHKARNSHPPCETCHGKMRKLNEEEDNNLLSPAQDLEEKLNSVDYDVWVCEQCGSVERYAFPNRHSQYSECPHCHTKAMFMAKDHVVVPPTTKSTGIGERIYECKYCRNQTRKRYTIPQKPDPAAAALAAGALLGSGSGRGGGIGGGFGGGRTGGGGGGGRW